MRTRTPSLKVVVLACVWLLLLLVVLLYYRVVPRQLWSLDALQRFANKMDADPIRPQQILAAEDPLTPKLLLSQARNSTSDEPSDWEKVQLYQRELPNVPFEYWYHVRFKPMRLNATCASAPWMFDLRFHNNHWQNFYNSYMTFRLYAAYFDARPHVPQGNVVRVLAMLDQLQGPLPTSYCQLWYEHQHKPVIVPVAEHRLIWYTDWGKTAVFYPYLLTCVVPKQMKRYAPAAVSLVAAECDTATNSLRVHFEPPPHNETRHGFAVCVKGLDYPYKDMSTRLIEWLEMQRLLGARKVIVYQLILHANISRVLSHYVQQGFLELRSLTHGSDVPTMPHYLHDLLRARVINKRVNEVIPYNDCFYRNMYKYEYIVNVDVDELIMPVREATTWQQLIELATQRSVRKECPNGYVGVCVLNVQFPINEANFTAMSDVPQYMFMLQHVQRLPDHSSSGMASKCLHNTSEALALHNHFALASLNSCRPLELEPDVAQLQHYRLLTKPEEWLTPVTDRSIWRYNESLLAAVSGVMRELGLPVATRN